MVKCYENGNGNGNALFSTVLLEFRIEPELPKIFEIFPKAPNTSTTPLGQCKMHSPETHYPAMATSPNWLIYS